MKSFRLLTEEKNTHMTHIEDSVFIQGINGTRQAIEYIQQMRDTLNGHAQSPIRASVKWDGAPAIFLGRDPTDGEFFVAKKGLFNKTPLLYKSLSEIDQASELSGELKKKFKLAFNAYKNAGITNIIQGDFLYDSEDVQKQKIAGEEYVTFHPNTIVYAIPTSSPLSRRIMASKCGMVWHTTYEGTDISSLKAKYGVKMPKVGNDVFQVDAMYKDLSGSASLTAAESNELQKKLSRVGTLFRKTQPKTFNIFQIPELQSLVLTYTNSFVRNRQKMNPNAAATGFVHFVADMQKREEEKRKTPRGKTGVRQKFQPLMRAITSVQKAQLMALFELYDLIGQSKMILIKKLNSGQFMQTFLRTAKGYQVTGQEGFVAIDRLGKNAVKLVDRLEFSFANFDSSVIKGWQSNARR